MTRVQVWQLAAQADEAVRALAQADDAAGLTRLATELDNLARQASQEAQLADGRQRMKQQRERGTAWQSTAQ